MKKLLIFICLFLVILPNLSIFTDAAYNSELVAYTPEIFYLANSDTDTVIFDKNSEVTCAPASLVKIATAALAIEFCKDIDTKITVSENAVLLLQGTGSSVAGLVAGESVTMRDLLYCLLLSGSNDAANVIAEYVAGDIPTFINLMNDFSNAIGCKNTRFVNCHGLDEQGQVTSARDMYLILKHAIGIPIFKEITANYSYKMPETNKSKSRTVYSRNPLINTYSDYYYRHIGGGITGSTESSGECLASFAQKDGYTYICIAMKGKYDHLNGSRDKLNTSYFASKKMYQWAFENMKLKIVANPSRIIDEVKVEYGEDVDYVSLVPEKEVTALVPFSAEPEGLSIVADAASKPESVKAPVKKGQVIAKANIYYSNEIIAEVNLVALNDVGRSQSKAVTTGIKDFFTSKPFIVILVLLIIGVVVFAVLSYMSGKRTGKKARRRKTPDSSNQMYTDFKK